MKRPTKRAKRSSKAKRTTPRKRGTTAKGMRQRSTIAQGKTVKSLMLRVDVAFANAVRGRAKTTGVSVTEITRQLAAHVLGGK